MMLKHNNPSDSHQFSVHIDECTVHYRRSAIGEVLMGKAWTCNPLSIKKHKTLLLAKKKTKKKHRKHLKNEYVSILIIVSTIFDSSVASPRFCTCSKCDREKKSISA